MRFLLSTLTPILLAVTATGQTNEIVEKIVRLERENPRVMEHLEYLTENIGPRLTGSPGQLRACEWAEATFESFGLEAWVEQWGTFPVGYLRGPSSGRMVEPVTYEFAFTTDAWTAGTPGLRRGPAYLMPSSADEVREFAEDLKGAWIVDPPRGDGSPTRSEMRGIVSALEEVDIAGRVTNANSGELLYAFGNYGIDWNDLPKTCTINLIQDQYEDLASRLVLGTEVTLEFDVDNRFLPGPFPVTNVIAELRGSELPDEYVIVGGHIDSWDPARGAQDNGTGCATTIEAARLLAEVGAKPKRSIRFMLWSGEEQGLMGSSAYTEMHPEEMERISAVFVHDAGTNYLSGISGPVALIGQLRTALEPVLTLDAAKEFTIRENGGLSTFGSSDHSSFIAKGVPGFAWGQTGRTSYRFSWHTQYDTIDYVVADYQEYSSMVAAIAAYNVANLPEKLDRTDLIDPDAGRGRRGRGGGRRMGVNLEGTEITSVREGGKAAAAGWMEGDVILAIDGVTVASLSSISQELQKGGPKKTIQLKRGEETIESVLDYSNE